MAGKSYFLQATLAHRQFANVSNNIPIIPAYSFVFGIFAKTLQTVAGGPGRPKPVLSGRYV